MRDILKKTVLPSGPQSVAEPEKELRFTRASQATLFYALSVLIFAATVGLFILSTQDWGMGEPLLAGWFWWCVPGLLLTFLTLRFGLRCTRHAYLILSPLGLEIFPWSKPEKNLQIIYWSEVDDAEFSKQLTRLTIHFDAKKKSGVVLSLRPIPKGRRALLERAVLGVLANKRTEDAT